MPYHTWNDDWFEEHGQDLDKAIDYCTEVWIKYGRIACMTKEKYGTFRDQLGGLWDGSLHSLIYPGYFRVMFWSWFYWNVDFLIIRKLSYYLGLVWLFQKYQAAVYNYAVQQVCKRYPKIVDEIVSDLDGYEMVKPGIFGKIDGVKIHSKYWTM